MFDLDGIGKQTSSGNHRFYFGMERDNLCKKLEDFVAGIRSGKILVQQVSLECRATVNDFQITELKIPYVETH